MTNMNGPAKNTDVVS